MSRSSPIHVYVLRCMVIVVSSKSEGEIEKEV